MFVRSLVSSTGRERHGIVIFGQVGTCIPRVVLSSWRVFSREVEANKSLQLMYQSWTFHALPKLCPQTEYFPLNIGFLFLKISNSRLMSSPTVSTMFCGNKKTNPDQAFLVITLLKICWWLKTISPSSWLTLFSSPVSLIIY